MENNNQNIAKDPFIPFTEECPYCHIKNPKYLDRYLPWKASLICTYCFNEFVIREFII